MKPEVTLTQLEEEPETGLGGLTFTEVKSVFIKSFVAMITIGIIAGFFLPIIGAGIAGIAAGVLFFIVSVKITSSKRADKPLYYQKHLKTHKNARLFIQPAKAYQRERTNK